MASKVVVPNKGRYDIVIFGVTGVTGKYVALEAIKASKQDPFTWAVAGRSANKLRQVLEELERLSGFDTSQIPTIVADVKSPTSLKLMAGKGKVVLNCVGPYLLNGGEQVIQACIQEGTHHVDISAECQFLERVREKYHGDAGKSGSLIIGPCGYGSVPTDYGGQYLQEMFPGRLNSVHSYAGFGSTESLLPKVNFATWYSLCLMWHDLSWLIKTSKKLDIMAPFPHPPEGCPLFSRFEGKYGFRLHAPDERVMRQTQKTKFLGGGTSTTKPPFQVRSFLLMDNIFMATILLLWVPFLVLLLQFKFGLRLLDKYHRFFSLGVVTSSEPTEEEMNAEYSFTLVGKGWGGENNDSTPSHPPDKTMTLEIRGRNPAYGGTVTMMMQCALVVLKERDKLPSSGGVYTPGIAFVGTSLHQRLHNNGVTFTIKDN